jgi:CRISPR/Cas system CMR-associated protein Cmr1 (group 7 of RAMP superfamily)
VLRLGASIGEVIKSNINQDFKWYEFDSVYHYSSKLDGVHKSIKEETALYSKKRDIVILPLSVAAQFLEGTSIYTNFLTYVEEVIRQHR